MSPTSANNTNPINFVNNPAAFSSTDHTYRNSDVIAKTDEIARNALTEPSYPTITVEDWGPDIDPDYDDVRPPYTNPSLEMDLVPNNTPKDTLTSLNKLDKNLKKLNTELNEVFEKGKKRAETLKVQHGIINNLKKDELIKLEGDLMPIREGVDVGMKKLQKLKNELTQLPDNHPGKREIKGRVEEVELTLKKLENELNTQLDFHAYSRLGRLLQMIAKILRELNEGMAAIRNIR